MEHGQAESVTRPTAVAGATPAIELRHLRYFVALADAGSFTGAAERIFITQPTLSQQIRRLEEIVGTQLLQRHRQGLQLTKAGAVLLDASRTVLSLVDHEVDRTRQAAGLGRPHLRVVVPPWLPNAFAVQAAPALRSVAAAADVEIVWMHIPLDAEFGVIRQRRADAGLGWLTDSPTALPAPLEAVSLGEFGPDVWIPSAHRAARRATIGLGELVRMDVIHGPRHAEPGTYEAWTRVLRTADPRFEFTDPPLRHSLAMDLAFAATADRPTAVLTGPTVSNGNLPEPARLPRPMVAHGMVRVGLHDQPLTATAALAWSRDLPQALQQILIDAAGAIALPHPAWATHRSRARTSELGRGEVARAGQDSRACSSDRSSVGSFASCGLRGQQLFWCQLMSFRQVGSREISAFQLCVQHKRPAEMGVAEVGSGQVGSA
jgi:DNA-binding transcriptional LysR family regulator